MAPPEVGLFAFLRDEPSQTVFIEVPSFTRSA
jgi:hypothetical protein